MMSVLILITAQFRAMHHIFTCRVVVQNHTTHGIYCPTMTGIHSKLFGENYVIDQAPLQLFSFYFVLLLYILIEPNSLSCVARQPGGQQRVFWAGCWRRRLGQSSAEKACLTLVSIVITCWTRGKCVSGHVFSLVVGTCISEWQQTTFCCPFVEMTESQQVFIGADQSIII